MESLTKVKTHEDSNLNDLQNILTKLNLADPISSSLIDNSQALTLISTLLS